MPLLRTSSLPAPGRTLAAMTAAAALTLAGCTAPPSATATSSSIATTPASVDSGSSNSSAGGSSSSSDSGSPGDADTVTLNLTVAGRKITPSGQKLNVRVGQTVVLNVTSDEDDEIHAHTGGDGYELEVKAGKPTMGSFTLTSPGSFEIESHHLEKTFVILNAR